MDHTTPAQHDQKRTDQATLAKLTSPPTPNPNDTITPAQNQHRTTNTERGSVNDTLTSSSESYKEAPNVETAEVNGDDSSEDGIDWKPGFRQQFPWIGFSGLVIIIVATSMAVAVLGASNNERVKDWPFTRFPIQPNVLINIANQFQNLGLITFISQGLAIAWWRKAMQGSSLGTLHRNHAYSYSFYSIVTSGKHFNIVALAALMTKFAIIDSTLFQKATKTIVTQQVNYKNVSVTGWMETNWPVNSGGVPGENGAIKTVDTAWAGVINAYNGKIANGKVHDTLRNNASFFDCPFRQECSGAFKALGFAFNCSTTTEDVNYGLQHQSSAGGVETTYPLWNIGFSSSWASDTKPYASINMDMLYVDSHAGATDNDCPGSLTRRTCEIRPAIVEYPVTVMVPSEEELEGRNIVTHVKFYTDNISHPLSTPITEPQIDQLKFLEYVDLKEKFNETSTIGALVYVLNNLYSSSANLTYKDDWDIVLRGGQAQTTFFADTDTETFSRCYYDIDRPDLDDPTVELLRKINTLSFVAALYLKGQPTTDVHNRTAGGMSSQTALTSVTGIVEEYKTDFNYVGGALAASFVTMLLVLPVYWGFWQLGRKVTLGPLEIANAFNAPVIRPDYVKAQHGDFEEVLQEVGKRRVRYGQLRDAPPGSMGIAEPDNVVKPSYRESRRFTRAQQGVVGVGLGATIGDYQSQSSSSLHAAQQEGIYDCIGKDLVAAYLNNPDTIVVTAVRKAASTDSLHSLSRTYGTRIVVIKVDVASTDTITRVITSWKSEHNINSLDVVLTNAGNASLSPKLIESEVSDIQPFIDINAYGQLELFKAVAALLRESKSETKGKFMWLSFEQQDVIVWAQYPGMAATEMAEVAFERLKPKGIDMAPSAASVEQAVKIFCRWSTMRLWRRRMTSSFDPMAELPW
ncbi:hypothetical protein BU25DRAFT_449747 [Macroventuria anomochaeta]|uniref:Uncharacterized protein n=1 Tax=Macroventuria anomochaeta TaxID=301207 RepID=A0ACB6RY48_9PLEO|nr:uncharacterized protein BU25DRAFT_449747 [Macroventuria anomochaeta]KAF2626069.1 hypothetical protein BU25DRAFT_449747 [Macroventuria anomochaeta]